MPPGVSEAASESCASFNQFEPVEDAMLTRAIAIDQRPKTIPAI
jgi:hypothetical protein